MAIIQHESITDPYIHEPKGVATANAGDVYIADGNGSGSWTATPVAGTVSQGAYEYGHNGSADVLTTADTLYELTNDAAHPTTINTYGLPGLTDIYDETAGTSGKGRFVFDNDGVLALGDTVHMLIEVYVTTPSTNTSFELLIELGPEGSGDYLTVLEETNFKTAGTYLVSRGIMFFMRTTDILEGGARILARSDTNATEALVDDYIVMAYHTN